MVVDYVAVAAAVAVWTGAVLSPGPAFAAIVLSSVSAGRDKSAWLVLGITTGSAVYGAATLFGLLWIISQLGAWSDAIRVLGAGYLIWLGAQSWKSADHYHADASGSARAPTRNAFVRGLLLELSNPKGIAFFLSVFAASMPLDASSTTKSFALIAGLIIELGWYLAVVLTFSRPQVRSIYARWRVAIARLFGLAFVGFGIGLLAWRH